MTSLLHAKRFRTGKCMRATHLARSSCIGGRQGLVQIREGGLITDFA